MLPSIVSPACHHSSSVYSSVKCATALSPETMKFVEVVAPGSVAVLVLNHEGRRDRPVVVQIHAQCRARAVGLDRVVIVLGELVVVDRDVVVVTSWLAEIGVRNDISVVILDSGASVIPGPERARGGHVVDPAGVLAVPAHEPDRGLIPDRHVDEALGDVAGYRRRRRCCLRGRNRLRTPWDRAWFVMMRIVPACELAPNSVPCGPASASTRAMSYMWMSRLPWIVVIGCSSRYMPTLGTDVMAWPSPPVVTPRMYTAAKPAPAP